MTLPLDAATVAALKESNQTGYLALLKQWQDTPQFFCCISGNTVGVAKDPVAILKIADRVVCIGDNVTVDFSLCWSPTDSLAGTPYTIRWGDGNVTNGFFPNPRNPAAETATYVGGYAAVGYYDITLEIQDTLGATAVTRLQVYARDCTQPANPLPFPPAIPAYVHTVWDANGAIVASDTNAYYTLNIHQAAPAWAAFSGAFAPTEIHDLMLELESGGSEYLYVADFAGIYSHPMPPNVGGWTTLVTSDQMAAAAGVDHTTHTCICQRLAISIGQDGWQWCTWRASRLFPHNVPYYVGVAHTRDGWQTIHHSAIVTQFAYNPAWTQELYIWGIDIVQGGDGQIAFAAVGYMEQLGVTENTQLFASTDYGANWSQVDSVTNYHRNPDVWIPYSRNGSVVYWANYDTLRISVNGGTSWATAAALAGTSYTNPMRLSGPIDDDAVVTAMINDELHEYRGGPVTHIVPDMPGGTPALGLLVRGRTVAKYGDPILWAGGTGITSYIKQNTGGGQQNKEGGWADPYPHAIGWPELREFAT